MKAPAFWWKKPGLAAALLSPAARIYGVIAERRLQRVRRGARVGIPVVCVGDMTVGGAGKTPTAIAVAKLLIEAGRNPMFLTRGYGGSLAGPVMLTPAHTAREVGDEPLLLARIAPTIVARDRVAGARFAKEQGAGIVVMDDGFQNPSLAKDFSILVVDGVRGIGNGWVLPAGPLRAPFHEQLNFAQLMLVLGEPVGAAPLILAAQQREFPTIQAVLMPDREAVAALRERHVLAFAGIGHPDKFFATLAAASILATVHRAFPDHHRYTARDAAALIAEADKYGLELVTTEKDLVRLHGDPAVATLAARARALPVTLGKAGEFNRLVRSLLAAI